MNDLDRDYDGADAFMLEKSEEMQAQFLLDIADFTAFDTELDNTFATNWLQQIENALDNKTDHTVVSEQKGKTSAVKQAMLKCKNAHEDIMYFAEKAFAGNPELLEALGKGKTIRKALRSQARLSEFMDEFTDLVDEHKTPMLNKGCPQTTIDNVGTVAAELRSFNKEQNLAIDGRPVVTKQRVLQLNAAYAPMKQVINAAQRVYRTNPTKLGQYVYNPPINHKFIVYQGTINEAETIALDVSGIDIDQIESLKLESRTAGVTLRYFAAPVPPDPGAPDSGHIDVTTTITLPIEDASEQLGFDTPGPHTLNVRNLSAADGSYKVTFIKK